MHKTAYTLGQLFLQSYIPKHGQYKLLDLGSGDFNGSLRQFCPPNVEYIGLDFAEGKNVDIVLKNAYEFPFKDNSADFVISSSCFEHSEFFWLSFKEIFRVLKPNGVFYINAPSNGAFHRHPMDCWRFYPDASMALLKWAAHCGHERPCLLESFMKDPDGDIWRDYVAVFLKDSLYTDLYPTRILDQVQGFTNGIKYGQTNYMNYTEDYTK
jgi:ubiquinone/menaquinone biosynthesis C-methylase UbiE